MRPKWLHNIYRTAKLRTPPNLQTPTFKRLHTLTHIVSCHSSWGKSIKLKFLSLQCPEIQAHIFTRCFIFFDMDRQVVTNKLWQNCWNTLYVPQTLFEWKVLGLMGKQALHSIVKKPAWNFCVNLTMRFETWKVASIKINLISLEKVLHHVPSNNT